MTQNAPFSDALAGVPDGLRNDVLGAFNEILTNFREGRWEPAELNGGKFCEAVYTVLDGHLRGGGGAFAARASKPKNFPKACSDLAERFEKEEGNHSARILIPRILPGLYDIRNNRGVGHVGGDVDPNRMDAMVVVSMSKWVLAELVRILHCLPTDTATSIVDGLVEREIAWVWRTDDVRRVIHTGLTWKEKTLVLLYSEAAPGRKVQLLPPGVSAVELVLRERAA